MESTKESANFAQENANELSAPDVDHQLAAMPPPPFQLQASEGTALQLKEDSSAPLQLAKGGVDNTVMPPALTGSSDAANTKGIHHTAVTYATDVLASTGETVGVKMEANPVGPDHPQGSGPDLKATAAHMAYMKKTGDTYIRGHLLNHDIGGPGVAENLFPITAMANSQHYHQIEKHVVDWVNTHMMYVYYKVEVKNRNDTTGYSEFHCEAYPLDAAGNKTGTGVQAVIVSDPGNSSGVGAAVVTGNVNAAAVEPNLSPAEVERAGGKAPAGYSEIDPPTFDLMFQDAGTDGGYGTNMMEKKLSGLGFTDEAIESLWAYVATEDNAVFQNTNKGTWNRWVAKINSKYT